MLYMLYISEVTTTHTKWEVKRTYQTVSTKPLFISWNWDSIVASGSRSGRGRRRQPSCKGILKIPQELHRSKLKRTDVYPGQIFHGTSQGHRKGNIWVFLFLELCQKGLFQSPHNVTGVATAGSFGLFGRLAIFNLSTFSILNLLLELFDCCTSTLLNLSLLFPFQSFFLRWCVRFFLRCSSCPLCLKWEQ